MCPALGALGFNHWTVRKVPIFLFIYLLLLLLFATLHSLQDPNSPTRVQYVGVIILIL